jgi:uncharacterized OB-fold protein
VGQTIVFRGLPLNIYMRTGIIYTETIVRIAPEAFQKDVPYQVAIVELADGTRLTARIEGDAVRIGDPVVETGVREGVSFFGKAK